MQGKSQVNLDYELSTCNFNRNYTTPRQSQTVARGPEGSRVLECQCDGTPRTFLQ